jgi:hypothetical protein
MAVRATGLLSLIFLFLGSGCSLQRHRIKFQPDPLPAFAAASMVVVDESGQERRVPLKDLTEHFVALSTRAQSNHRSDINEFIAAGLNVSDEIVERWFKQQLALESASRYHQNAANVAGGFATAFLGITDASSRAVGILGAGVTAMNAQWRNVEAYYLLSPALPVVIEKLRGFRAEQREAILTALKTQEVSYNEAVAILRSYHQIASRETVQRYLQKSAELARFSATYDEKSGATEAEIGAQSSVVYALLNEDAAGFYSERDLAALFAILTEPADSDVLTALRATPRYRAIADRVADLTESGRNRLIGRMLVLDGLLGLEKRVEAMREAAAVALIEVQFGTRLSTQARREFTDRSASVYSLLNDNRAGSFSVDQLVDIYAIVHEDEHPLIARRIERVPETAQLAERVRAVQEDPRKVGSLAAELEGLDRLLDLRRRVRATEDDEHGLTAFGRRQPEPSAADRAAVRVAEAVREALNSPTKRNLMSDWKVVPGDAK